MSHIDYCYCILKLELQDFEDKINIFLDSGMIDLVGYEETFPDESIRHWDEFV